MVCGSETGRLKAAEEELGEILATDDEEEERAGAPVALPAGKEQMIGDSIATARVEAGKDTTTGGVGVTARGALARGFEARTINVIRIIKPRVAAVDSDAAIIQPKSRKRCQRELQNLTAWKGGVLGRKTRRSDDDDPLKSTRVYKKKRN